jgi:hypothetical protein
VEARNKPIEQWFAMIEQGQIVLPRFQRHEAWRSTQIVGLLETIFRKPSLPIGAILTLEIGDKEPFFSRPIVGAPMPTSRPQMHLLDGQQRMTALWRSLTDNYEDLKIFVSLSSSTPNEELSPDEAVPDVPLIEGQRRWDHKGTRRPVWADSSVEVFKRDLIPAACFRPGRNGEKMLEEFLKSVREGGFEPGDKLSRIYELRQRIAGYLIPFLSLPVGTGRETALNVFIKMNTSASPLRDFDIVVAQLEESSGESLHDKVLELKDFAKGVSDYGSVEDNILSIAALLGGRAPLKKTYLEPDFGELLADVWPRLRVGVKRGIEFLREEGIFSEKLLATEVAFYLVCALWADVPEHGFDAEGNARGLIRKALWRAAFTDRYGKTSATRAFADYKTLSAQIIGSPSQIDCELFDDRQYPLPQQEELLSASWPGRKDRLPRAILALALRAGSSDFADGARARADNISGREYHHIFPVDILGGNRKDSYVNRALNCALITWRTNRKLSAKNPKDYIEARTKAAKLGEDEIRARLATHLIPYDKMLDNHYEEFLVARAELVVKHISALCDGRGP